MFLGNGIVFVRGEENYKGDGDRTSSGVMHVLNSKLLCQGEHLLLTRKT